MCEHGNECIRDISMIQLVKNFNSNVCRPYPLLCKYINIFFFGFQ